MLHVKKITIYTDILSYSVPPPILSNTTFLLFMEEKYLHHPLLPLANPTYTIVTTTSTTAGLERNSDDKITSSKFSVLIRLFFLLSIAAISLWANLEASKGFVITVVNNVKATSAGEKFTLFYISHDEAVRLVQSSSKFAAKILFPGDSSIPEKLIDQVEVQLVSHNLTNGHTVDVKSLGQKSKYILSINHLVMEFSDFKYRIRKEIQRGMAEILLFDQRNNAPWTLLDGMVEYITDLAGFGGPKTVFKLRNSSEKCWEDKDPRVVAKFLAFCEEKSEGCVGRLNQEMNRDGWYEDKLDKVLGLSAIHLCVEL